MTFVDLPKRIFSYSVHPVANLVPPMSEQEFNALVQNIRENGFRDDRPIILSGGDVLDGRHRLYACQKIRESVDMMDAEALSKCPSPKFQNWNGECGSIEAFVISENLARRHLSEDQLYASAAALLDYRKKEEGPPPPPDPNSIRGQALARQVEAGKHGSKGGRGKKNPGGKVSPRVSGKARDDAAEAVGLPRGSGKTVEKLAKAFTEKPELRTRVLSGEMKKSEAIKEAGLAPKRKQPPPRVIAQAEPQPKETVEEAPEETSEDQIVEAVFLRGKQLLMSVPESRRAELINRWNKLLKADQ